MYLGAVLKIAHGRPEGLLAKRQRRRMLCIQRGKMGCEEVLHENRLEIRRYACGILEARVFVSRDQHPVGRILPMGLIVSRREILLRRGVCLLIGIFGHGGDGWGPGGRN